jgi:hypothetical protein
MNLWDKNMYMGCAQYNTIPEKNDGIIEDEDVVQP